MSMAYTIKRYMCFVSLVLVFVVILSTEARADLYGFKNITNNLAGDAAIGEAQLFVDVTPYSGNQVLFTFSNAGSEASSICDVYFEDGSLLGIAEIFDAKYNESLYPGVRFSKGANPPDLPSGNTMQPPFNVTAGFLADSDPKVQPNGVNPGESLGILFNLIGGQTFTDVIAAINQGFTGPIVAGESLRIGIHVQGFDSGGSESFVLTPEPGSLLLGSIGLGMVIARCRKRKTLIES